MPLYELFVTAISVTSSTELIYSTSSVHDAASSSINNTVSCFSIKLPFLITVLGNNSIISPLPTKSNVFLLRKAIYCFKMIRLLIKSLIYPLSTMKKAIKLTYPTMQTFFNRQIFLQDMVMVTLPKSPQPTKWIIHSTQQVYKTLLILELS